MKTTGIVSLIVAGLLMFFGLFAIGGSFYSVDQGEERWDGKLPTSIPPNGTVPFMNIQPLTAGK